MVKLGDVAVKLAGRDAGELCAVVDVIDSNYVLIEGNTRRRKCNPNHLEFLGKQVKIKKNATRDEVLKALKETGLEFKEVKKVKSKEKTQRTLKLRKHKVKENKETKKEDIKVEEKKSSKAKKTK